MKEKTKAKLVCKELNTGVGMCEHTLDAIVSPGYYRIECSDVGAGEGFPDELAGTQLSAYLEVTTTNCPGDRLKERAIGQVLTVTDGSGTTNIYSRSRTKSGGVYVWNSWSGVSGKSAGDIMDGAITAQKLSSELRKEVGKITDLETAMEQEKNALVTGNTIVGIAREVYSAQGRNDTATFLKRSTAGGTTIGNGVATLKQIGGNIIKNLVDGTFNDTTGFSYESATGTLQNDVLVLTTKNAIYGAVRSNDVTNIETHIYYTCAKVFNYDGDTIRISVDGGLNQTVFSESLKWGFISHRGMNTYSVKNATIRLMTSDQQPHTMYVKDWLIIDLTEMYGSGKEPSKEECDKMFSVMGALPKGLNVAQPPTEFKSTGFNQCNPANILANKCIASGVVADSNNTSVAIVECLPCALGTGENNGYVIGYGEGDEWSDSGVEVYLTPLNPTVVNGELYLHKLEKNTTYGTYLPGISGYLLIVTPQTEKLCVHLHWSGDRPATDYEPYVESRISLPPIPQMSEWGLAGISTSGKIVQDIIDLENNKYIKKISCLDMDKLSWQRYSTITDSYIYYARISNKDTKLLIAQDAYRSIPYPGGISTTQINDGDIFTHPNLSVVYLRDDSAKDINTLKSFLFGKKIYYSLPVLEEYNIIINVLPNYISSDYGVEEFKGIKVSLAVNILFYMRSLVNEVRNFLDRLMAATGTTDVNTVADKLVAALGT